MAGLETLTAMVYHERQQPGSMLCAQHALNALLQGNYFTAPDLAAIANSFDALEHDALVEELRQATSSNMDDTGFFSVQVMDKALEVWGLNLVRWRSERMRPFQASPHTQLAFVLNLHQHWFTLRRFGPARTDPASDPGEGHWFNLNSQYLSPKWVSRTYLGMFLEQSEEEGYSVFAVVQADPSKPLALPRTEADNIAASLDGPDSIPGHSSSSMPGSFPESNDDVIIPEDLDYDVNNEDVELQAALAASLTDGRYTFGHDTYVPRAPIPAPELRQAPPPPMPLFGDDDEDMDTEGANAAAAADPIAASMARNRAMLDQMRRVQEAALRETYEDEGGNLARAQQVRTQQEEENEAVRRAIAESMGEHGVAGDMDEDDEEWHPEGFGEDNKENASSSVRARLQPIRGAAPVPSGAGTPPAEGSVDHRVYDDEDAELQAALRASLETMPEGYVRPPTPPSGQPTLPTPPADSSSTVAPPGISTSTTVLQSEVGDADDGAADRCLSPPAPAPQIDVEEMRRRRLARFGGQGVVKEGYL